MPLWTIHHPVGAYSEQDKRDFAADVTATYSTTIGLPKFYVVTLFREVDAASFLIGGEPRDDTVRVVVEHIAVHVDDVERRRRTAQRLHSVIAPYTTDRGLHVEFHVDETPRDLWMIDGLYPPPFGSDAEKIWYEKNQPVPY